MKCGGGVIGSDQEGLARAPNLDNLCHEGDLSLMATMNVSLPDEMRSYVESQVATGYFANASDFVRHLIRMDSEEGRGRLRELIAEGDRGGISDLTFDEIIAQARESKKSRAA